jgi:LytTr DNA-binding domain
MKFYNKPYPFNENLRYNAKIIFFISIGILGVLLIFQPLELAELNRKDVFYLTTGLAASTFLSLILNLIVLPSLFPKLFNPKRWKVKSEIFWNIWIVFTIMASNFLFYSKLFGFFEIGFDTIGKLLLLSVLPVSVLITINQDRLLRSHLKSAEALNKKLSDSRVQDEKLVTFNSDYKNDDLSLKVSSLLLIRSANNYIEIFYRENSLTKSHMVRCSMNRAERTVRDFTFALRCHRMFIVNINHIIKVEGNSQGYRLALEGVEFPVMVSQKYISAFKRIIS